jgi:hypothetical protein
VAGHLSARGSFKGTSLFTGALVGNVEGLPELLREKEKYIWVPSLDPKDIKI